MLQFSLNEQFISDRFLAASGNTQEKKPAARAAGWEKSSEKDVVGPLGAALQDNLPPRHR
jgi:hypothetical protein